MTALSLDGINAKLEDHSKLTAIRFSEPLTNFKRRVVCRCICGRLKSFDISNLLAKKNISCGCMKKTTAFSISDINKRIKSKIIAIEFSTPSISKLGNKSTRCVCQCFCGKIFISHITSLIAGNTKSCGCSRIGKKRPQKYTVNNHIIYQCWKHIISRCYNKKDKRYKDYGGRGVSVCSKWKNSYQSFLDWSLTNGWAKKLQLDKDIKIPDSLIYSPETCSWVDQTTNSHYKRNSCICEIDGVKVGLRVYCKNIGLDKKYFNRIYGRIRLGWSIKKAITEPIVIPNVLAHRKTKVITLTP